MYSSVNLLHSKKMNQNFEPLMEKLLDQEISQKSESFLYSLSK